MHDLMEVFGVASVLARLQLYLVDQFRDLDRSRLIIFLCQQHLVISQIICVQSSTVLVLMLHKSDDAHAVLIVATFFVGIQDILQLTSGISFGMHANSWRIDKNG